MGNNANAFTITNPSMMGDNTDGNNATTVTQTEAAATTVSTLGNTYSATRTSATFPAEVTAAI